MAKEKYYITTAIAYASARPHFGNTYEVIMTDCVARYKRQRGFDVFFLTGTDEHGQKIEDKAKEAGISPKEYVDNIANGQIKRIWDLMNTSYDKFIRTTDDYHEKAVQNIFTKLYEQGDIYKGEYSGWYCTPCESFFTDTQAEGGKCPDCGRPVEKAKEEAYFFKMSKYADRLIKHIEENPEFIEPESRKKEMVNNFLKAGLQDLCVSRTSFKWGIPVPFDDKHVVYVWLDALFNYATALGFDPANEVQPACASSALRQEPRSVPLCSVPYPLLTHFSLVRSRTISPPSATTPITRPSPPSSRRTGRLMSTSSVRTSSASTPSTGRSS